MFHTLSSYINSPKTISVRNDRFVENDDALYIVYVASSSVDISNTSITENECERNVMIIKNSNISINNVLIDRNREQGSTDLFIESDEIEGYTNYISNVHIIPKETLKRRVHYRSIYID